MTTEQRISTDMQPGDEIDLIALWRVLRRYKYLILILGAAFALAAVVIALKAQPIFRAEVVITAVTEDEMGGIGALANQFGGLASMVGVNLRPGGGAAQDAIAVLQSRRLVQEFIKRYVPLGEILPNSKKPPTLWLAVKRFREKVVDIDDSGKDSLKITIDWGDPVMAARWANDFVALANDLIRTRAIEEANRNINYLNEQLARTNVVELRRVMYSLIESQMKRLMMANGRIEYAFTSIDPAVPPEIRRSPQRTIIVLVGGSLGLVLGIVVALLLNTIARYRRRAALMPAPALQR